jgi:choline dehydrogenase-like flavoprotein
MAGEQSNPRNGNPLPEARQGKFASELTTNVFMSEERWNESREHGNFDYVVIGSSFCAWAFTQRMLENNPKAKILILERGEYYHLDHFENLPPSRKRKLTYESKTSHWNRTEKMQNEGYEQDGMNDVFGGQSAFWRGWCPQPTTEDLDGWPEGVKDIIEKYFPQAAELLNVVSADPIQRRNEGLPTMHCISLLFTITIFNEHLAKSC